MYGAIFNGGHVPEGCTYRPYSKSVVPKPANHLPIFLLLFIKIVVGLFFILSVFTSILGFSKFIAFAAACILAKFIYSSEYFVERYLQIEAQFMINLNAKTLAAQKTRRQPSCLNSMNSCMSNATV